MDSGCTKKYPFKCLWHARPDDLDCPAMALHLIAHSEVSDTLKECLASESLFKITFTGQPDFCSLGKIRKCDGILSVEGCSDTAQYTIYPWTHVDNRVENLLKGNLGNSRQNARAPTQPKDENASLTKPSTTAATLPSPSMKTATPVTETPAEETDGILTTTKKRKANKKCYTSVLEHFPPKVGDTLELLADTRNLAANLKKGLLCTTYIDDNDTNEHILGTMLEKWNTAVENGRKPLASLPSPGCMAIFKRENAEFSRVFVLSAADEDNIEIIDIDTGVIDNSVALINIFSMDEDDASFPATAIGLVRSPGEKEDSDAVSIINVDQLISIQFKEVIKGSSFFGEWNGHIYDIKPWNLLDKRIYQLVDFDIHKEDLTKENGAAICKEAENKRMANAEQVTIEVTNQLVEEKACKGAKKYVCETGSKCVNEELKELLAQREAWDKKIKALEDLKN